MPRRTSALPPLTAEQQRLAMTCHRLAMLLSQRWARSRPFLRDEYESAAMFALVLAAQDYDETRSGVPFVLFAHTCVRRALTRTTRAWCPKGYRISGGVSAPEIRRLTDDDEGEAFLADAHHREYEAMADFDDRLKGLSARSREVLRLVFVEGCIQREVGARLGISSERARQLYVRAVTALGGTCTEFPDRALLGTAVLA